ncbi:glycosyltransferase family 2 protein [Prevotella sp. PINT]|jgi:Glycosyltransferases involved in cell wall biogenesis|uniref:glycosyltransferase family 2 protein n=1 Tax=Palleniella intestinalis TaxID=2736291 RepID=UPI001553BB52|nr:glycosyltransferase family 2 protein [Palleniella intestinalis]NPD82436.1 glycosyltransferase family 2 protein [Palleniella intestinalis]
MINLSIIIPAYNAEKFLPKCLESCLHQDIPTDDYEIIVVDDGSTDNTSKIVDSYQNVNPNVRYIFQENAKQGAARNNGLRQACGEYIWFVDADDWIKENCLNRILTALKEKDLEGITVGHATLHGQELKRWRTFDETKIVSGKDLLCDSIFLISPTYTIWKRSHLIDNGLFFIEGMFHEDTEICPRMYYRTNRIGFINEICYFVYQNPESTTRGINPKRAFDLVTVVRELSCFAVSAREQDILVSLNNYMSEALNASLYNTYKFDCHQERELNRLWYENRNLFRCLLCTNVLKYKLEGILFRMFPWRISKIYKCIQIFNATPGGMKRK